jgi:SNW domain-containing protein 1
MTSLSLPPPRKTPALTLNNLERPTSTKPPPTDPLPQQQQQQQQQQEPPNYGERCRAATSASKMTAAERKHHPLFVPRSIQDFGDGGAFPEIHVAQYPRHMGNPHLKQQSNESTTNKPTNSAVAQRAIVNVQVDQDGAISYDAIVKRGTNQDQIVYSRHSDLKGGPPKPEDIALPTPEEEQAEATRTQNALLALLEPSQKKEETQFIQYTPRPDAPGYNPAASQRIIQMVPAQVDPLQPPKHKFIKAPRGPAEDPVPVLHAPTSHKVTKEEREAWNVPSCISNWKNMRGYTIPLDKRLAADGRHARETVTVNPNFATLSESLYVAERQARQEVRLRATIQKKLALQQKEEREQELRQLAQQARMERNVVPDIPADRHSEESDRSDDDEDAVAAQQRERLRQERRKERERDLRNEQRVKKQKLEAERDVSEKIALGVATGVSQANEVDARLYDQTAGMDSGFGAEDEYNAYSKPLFERQAVASSIYRPTRDGPGDADEQYAKLVQGATAKFKPDQGFAGAEGGVAGAAPRTGPVQFEKK